MKFFSTILASTFWLAAFNVNAQMPELASDALVSSPFMNGATEALPAPGSAWADLDGKVIKYEYDNFGGFQLHFRDEKLKWRGFVGSFENVVAEVDLIASKVADGIYFMSWPTVGDGGDNVVMNLVDMTVSGHLNGGAEDFDMIAGPIHCVDGDGCEIPEGDPMQQSRVMIQLFWNAWTSGYLTPFKMMAGVRDPNLAPEADKAGKAELTGKTFAFETPEGLVKVSVDGDETVSVVGDAAPETSITYATKIADGVYYVSWHGAPSGNHVVFNSHNMKVYDQILADGTRAEAIYTATCFSDTDC